MLRGFPSPTIWSGAGGAEKGTTAEARGDQTQVLTT